MKREVYEEYQLSHWWKPDMIPFLRDYSGDDYCVRTLPEDHSIVWVPHDDAAYVYYKDIESFIDTVIECYRQGAYFLDEDGLLDEDYELAVAQQIRERLNPGLSKRVE